MNICLSTRRPHPGQRPAQERPGSNSFDGAAQTARAHPSSGPSAQQAQGARGAGLAHALAATQAAQLSAQALKLGTQAIKDSAQALVRDVQGRPTWQKAALGGAASVLLLHVGLCSYIYGTQRHMLYKPQPRHLPVAQNDLRLNFNGNLLQISHREPSAPVPGAAAGAKAPALIYFGGNAEDVSTQLKRFARIWPHRELYLLHYRGWGASGGKPSEANLMADALAVFDHVKARHDEVAIVGRSLGTGVAVQVASQRPVQQLVLVTPYDSIAQVARTQMPFWVPVNWLLKDRWESARFAGRISAPTTLIQAEHDTTIAAERTATLFKAFAPGVATLHLLRDVNHHTILFSRDYHRLLAEAIG
jgi:hypothetical protein